MALTPNVITRFSGLYGSVNPLSGRVPPGAMEVANNLVVRASFILEPRRGYAASSPIPAAAPPTPETPVEPNAPLNAIGAVTFSGTDWRVDILNGLMIYDPAAGSSPLYTDSENPKPWRVICIPPATWVGGACIVLGG